MKKLDAWSPLGYSCVGEVMGVAPDVMGFKTGDIVACGGLTASHAEVVSVPVNLCVKLPSQNPDDRMNPVGGQTVGLSDGCTFEKSLMAAVNKEKVPDRYLKMAAYNTLGAIALQGVRQANLRLAETCTVIGLGLLGQLTCLLLRASGVKVVGVDVNPVMVAMAREHCADLAIERNDVSIESRIRDTTLGIGCDAVIITAGSDSLDPINFAGAIARKRGTVVVVGAIPTGFDRDPHYYRKELQIRMSCSYGPGRYDPEYEEKGRDYPVGYVRWTEKRNMQAFQELIASGKIDLGYLTTHVFKLEDAPKAYDLILQRSEPFVGILIEYDRKKKNDLQSKEIDFVFHGAGVARQGENHIRVLPRSSVAQIGFIGAGSYAQSHLLPNIPKGKDVALKGVMTSTSASSRSVADRFGFEFCTGKADDILRNEAINTVFIASHHDSHAAYVLAALEAGKHVFVEKPLCLTIAELDEIRGRIVEDVEQGTGFCNPSSAICHPVLMVGYNRRFAPLSRILKEKMSAGPLAMVYRINAGTIAPDSWIQDKEIGGGRIVGEVCHFVDYLTFLSGSRPVQIQAFAADDPLNLQDTITISLRFQDGSIGTIAYFANGSKYLPKEYIEVHAHGLTAILQDFRELSIYAKGKPFRKKLLIQDKGQKEEVRLFLDAVRSGTGSPISIEDIFSTSKVCFAILDSLRTGSVISI